MESLAKPFGKDKYAWYRLKDSAVLKSKMGRKHRLNRGDKFGIRDATSKKGMKRVIVDNLGKNIVFSMRDAEATKLMKKAAKASVTADSKEIKFSLLQIKFILNSTAIACFDVFSNPSQAKKYIYEFVELMFSQQEMWHKKIPTLQKMTYQSYVKARKNLEPKT